MKTLTGNNNTEINEVFYVEVYDNETGYWEPVSAKLKDFGEYMLCEEDYSFSVEIDPEFYDFEVDNGELDELLLDQALRIMKNVYWDRENI